jgi:rSAM/selenodomain-associated transferase 1
VPARRAAAWPRGVAVVVLAKHPSPGRVKTRLAASIGPVAAADLYAAFVRDLAARLRMVGCPVWWSVAPARAEFARLVRSRRVFPQRGRDLGARMHRASRVVAARTGGAVIVLGADAPHLSVRALGAAARALARGADVVLGPAADGGYWLIGLRRPCRPLFDEMAWSTPGVAAATRRRCRTLGLRCVEVARGWDVDDAHDLAAFARSVRRRPAELPHSRAALARLTRRA